MFFCNIISVEINPAQYKLCQREQWDQDPRIDKKHEEKAPVYFLLGRDSL